MENGKGKARQVLRGLISGALFALVSVVAVVSCTPAPEPAKPPVVESKPATPSQNKVNLASLPRPITVRVPKSSPASRPDARGSLSVPVYTETTLTQLSSIQDVLNPPVKSAPVPKVPEPVEHVLPQVKPQAAVDPSSLGHPAPALPIPETARQDAGRAALAERLLDSPPLVTSDDVERANRNLPDDQALKTEADQRSVLLEASFLALVLICIFGAMWYRMSSNFGHYPRRRSDWDR